MQLCLEKIALCSYPRVEERACVTRLVSFEVVLFVLYIALKILQDRSI